MADALPTPVPALARDATCHTTPCGDGGLAWREWGRGRPIVLLHGGFGSWLHWVHNIAPLATTRRVLTVDLPGLGDSAEPPGEATARSVSEPVIAGLAQLIGPHEAIDIVGFSFGGLIGGQVAAALGAQARSLTLVGASGLGLQRQRIDLVRRTPEMTPAETAAAQAANLRTLMLHDAASLDALALAIQAHNDARARIKSRRLSLGSALRDALPRVSARVNGIWGEHDITAVPWMDERRALLAELCDDLAFEIIAGAGHWVQFEAAAAFNVTLQRLLDR